MARVVIYLFISSYFLSDVFGITYSDIPYLIDIQNAFCDLESCTNIASVVHTQLTNTATPFGQTPSWQGLPPWSADTLSVQPPDPERRPKYCCEECSCDTSNCYITGTCCLETLKYLPSTDPLSDIIMTCALPQLRPYKEHGMVNVGRPIYMFRKCLKDIDIAFDIVHRCEEPDKYDNIDSNIPVTDVTTGYIYQNRYCAYCHAVNGTNLRYWDVYLRCLDGSYQPQNTDVLIKEIRETETCNLLYYRPEILGIDAPLYQCKTVISECNVTGQWKTYDAFIESACSSYSTIFDFEYRNVFCYICNTDDVKGPTDCRDRYEPTVIVDFTALLKIQHDKQMTNKPTLEACSENQIYDPLMDKCRDINCLFPKIVERETCVNFIETLGGVNYGIFLKITPLDELNPADSNAVNDTIEHIKAEVMEWLNLKQGAVTTYMYAKYNITTTNSEAIGIPVQYFVVYVEVEFTVMFPLDVETIDVMLAMHGNVITTATELEYKVEISVYQFISDLEDSLGGDPESGSLQILSSPGILSEYSHAANYPRIVLSKLNTCPLVRITSSEYTITRFLYDVHIDEFNITIDNRQLLIENITGSDMFSVRMCSYQFEELVARFARFLRIVPEREKCEEEPFSAKGILSLVCTIISISFLLLSLTIYLTLNELKTQPGINNIVLCTLLIIAQTLFQFGSGQSCNVSETSCMIIGALVHFSWLLVVFWMNVCCVHMFRVFRSSQTIMISYNTTKTTVFYIFYCVTASTFPVLINIIISLSISGWQNIGYGGSLCYITDSRMVSYVFALPVGVVIVSNILLYLVVVVQMKHMPNVQNDKSERNYIKIYTKLSTITGCTWIFGFLSLILNIVALEYIFISLNASQGMFLFFAFIANKRTLKLLKCEHKDDSKRHRNKDGTGYTDDRN